MDKIIFDDINKLCHAPKIFVENSNSADGKVDKISLPCGEHNKSSLTCLCETCSKRLICNYTFYNGRNCFKYIKAMDD